MVKKHWRARGEREERGLTKKRIVLFIANYFPEGVEEPEIRNHLRENFNIKSSKGIKQHLASLNKLGIFEKTSMGVGKENLWNITSDKRWFQNYCFTFLKSEWKFEFLESKYAQSMLDEDFLNRKFQRFYEDVYLPTKEAYKEMYETDEEIRNRIDSLNLFSEKLLSEKIMSGEIQFFEGEKLTLNIIRILRKSPLLLYYVLFPFKIYEDIAPLLRELNALKEELSIVQLDILKQMYKQTPKVLDMNHSDIKKLIE